MPRWLVATTEIWVLGWLTIAGCGLPTVSELKQDRQQARETAPEGAQVWVRNREFKPDERLATQRRDRHSLSIPRKVVGEIAGQQLSVFVIDEVLREGAAQRRWGEACWRAACCSCSDNSGLSASA